LTRLAGEVLHAPGRLLELITMFEGFVCSVKLDRNFGFIAMPDSPDIFFHMQDLTDGLEFDETLLQRRVKFDLKTSGKGPRAFDIRPAD
jgi:cold shock CspA family protein